MKNRPCYDENYYLNECDGYSQFRHSKGKILNKRLQRIFDLAEIQAGMRMLDIGCGRAELVWQAARLGAWAVGVDNSPAALALARGVKKYWEKEVPGIGKRVDFILTTAEQMNFEKEVFDVVLMTDFVEHISSSSLDRIFHRIRNMIKSGGRVVIYTSPNRWFVPVNGVIFALISRWLRLLDFMGDQPGTALVPWRIRPCLGRGLQKDFHPQEQNSWRLKRLARRNGFEVEKIDFIFNPHYLDFFFSDSRAFRIWRLLGRIFPVKHIFYADLCCVLRA